MLEYAPNYFDLSTFPDSETKRALLRVQKKRTMKVAGSASNGRNSPSVGDQPPAKKKRST